MKFDGRSIAEATCGTLLMDGPAGPIATDTRGIPPGAWFVALKGERFDGHDFLGVARQAGCAGVVVHREIPSDWDRGAVRVPNTLQALQDLAMEARNRFSGPVVGITGSVGKTTTRALTALALHALGRVYHTTGNLNNHIGLPLTLLGIPEEGAEVLVLEFGMSAPGEIRRLQDIARPTHRLITNVAPAHLEGLGSIENIVKEKGELFASARPGDVVCVNLDDPRVAGLPVPNGVRKVFWGASRPCDVRLLKSGIDGESTWFEAEISGRVVRGVLPVPGLHLPWNACAALALAYSFGLDCEAAAARMSAYMPVGMRMRLETHPLGFRVLNDAYNANPASMAAALSTLTALPGTRRVALLGDMLELGSEEVALHREVLERALSLPIDLVGACGPRMQAAASGLPSDRLVVAPDLETLAHVFSDLLETGDVVLVKGSRGMAMERVLPMIRGKVA